MPKKLRLGFFSLSCCEGCSLVFFDLEQNLLKALKFLDIVEARLFDGKHPDQWLDVAIVEGGVQNERDKRELIALRERCTYLIGFGACATIGGVPGMRNALPKQAQAAIKKKAIKPIKQKVYPINAFVKVDYLMQGCPVFTHELLDVLVKLFHGIRPVLEEVPVCMECREQENSCMLFQGIPCLGPVTYAGCKALCPSNGAQCIGCRGFLKEANFEALLTLFKQMNVSEREIMNLLTYFNENPLKGGKHDA